MSDKKQNKRIVLKTIDDIKKLEGQELEVGTILDHKEIEPYIVAGELVKIFPNAQIFTAMVGTEIYVKYGVNVSLVSRI